MTDPHFGLHHVLVAIPADSEEQARQFYGEVLGLTEVAKPTALAARGGCWFRAGELEIHLGVEEPFSPARKAHPGILVTQGFDGLLERLTGHGIDATPDDNFPGFRRVYIADPFGNRLELMTPQTATSDATGPTDRS